MREPPWFIAMVTTEVQMCGKPDGGYDPYDFVVASGTARLFVVDGESRVPWDEPSGIAELAVIDAGQASALGVDVVDVCDAVSEELLHVSQVVFGADVESKLEREIRTCLYVADLEPGPISAGAAVYAIDRCIGGGSDVIAVAHDMNEFGFRKQLMPAWRQGCDLWWIDTRDAKKSDFPVPRPLGRVIRPPKKVWRTRSSRRGT